MLHKLPYESTIQRLQKPDDPVLEQAVAEAFRNSGKTIVVIDDDPTGMQTVSDVPLLLQWTEELISNEIERGSKLFFILTNLRSLDVEAAKQVMQEVVSNVQNAFAVSHQEFIIILRSDSTLRGHFPLDVDCVQTRLQSFRDVVVHVPAFIEGGRLSIDGVHYLRQDDALVPVAQSEFAADIAFGYRNSNLAEWLHEKAGHRIMPSDVWRAEVDLLNKPVEKVQQWLNALPHGAHVVVDAISYAHLQAFALACWRSHRRFLFRTAASFVRALSGQHSKPLFEPAFSRGDSETGGLVVIGSYTEKTTRQLDSLLQYHHPVSVALDVEMILTGDKTYLQTIIKQCNQRLQAGQHLVIYTSRQLVAGNDNNLQVNQQVSEFVCGIISALRKSPAFLITKGGITSNDIATKGLQTKRAVVIGQALPGVPVWICGEESRFPGLPIIIFPGNVGKETDLSELFGKLVEAGQQ